MKELNTKKLFLNLLFLTMAFFFCVNVSFAQPELPQRTITVSATQPIQFGTLAVSGAGGTVTVSPTGVRSSSGGITVLASSYSPAIFEIKLCQGRNVIITFAPTTTLLDGSNSLILDIGPTERGPSGSVFFTNNDCNFITPLRVGGTLNVPGGAAPGTYTGSFNIIFNQE